jgi:hypothetical protein
LILTALLPFLVFLLLMLVLELLLVLSVLFLVTWQLTCRQQVLVLRCCCLQISLGCQQSLPCPQ